MCPRQPNVPTAAQIKTPYPLGHCTLCPCPERILRFELRRLLALPRGLERLVVHLGLHRELAGCLGGGGPCLAGGAGTTGRPVKPDADDGLAGLTLPCGPFDTALALGALGLLRLPVDHKGVEVIAVPVPLLPTRGAQRGPYDIDLMVYLGTDQDVRDDIATVDEVVGRDGARCLSVRLPIPYG